MLNLLFAIGYLLFAVLAWRRFPWAVLLVIATLPSYLIRFRIGPIPTTLLEGMLLIVILAASFHRVKKVRATPLQTPNFKIVTSEIFNYPLRRKLALPLGLFLLTATVSLFIAPDLRAAAGIWKAYFIEPIIFFVVLLDLLIHHPNLLNRRQIIGALSVSALLLSLYAIFQRFTGFGIPPPWDAELRVTSIFPYPNALGLFLGPLIPLFLMQLFAAHQKCAISYDRKKLRGLASFAYWLLVLISSIVAITFAKSTGALVGMIVGLLFMAGFWIHKRYQRKQLAISYWLLAIGAIVILLMFSPLRRELLLQDWSGHVRRTQWAETWKMLKDRPVLGAGLAGYKETLAPYHKANYIEIFEYPHNIVLNFWSETGLLGLIAFIWLIIIFYRQAFRAIQHNAIGYSLLAISAAASMATLLIHGLVDVPYFKNDLSMLFWIIFALGLTNAQKSEMIQS